MFMFVLGEHEAPCRVKRPAPFEARRLLMTEEASPTGSTWKIDEILVHRTQRTLGLGFLGSSEDAQFLVS